LIPPAPVQKRKGGSDFSKPPFLKKCVTKYLRYDGFFLLPSCGSLILLLKKEPITVAQCLHVIGSASKRLAL